MHWQDELFIVSISVTIELKLLMIGKDEVEIGVLGSFCIAASFDRTDGKLHFISLLCGTAVVSAYHREKHSVRRRCSNRSI